MESSTFSPDVVKKILEKYRARPRQIAKIVDGAKLVCKECGSQLWGPRCNHCQGQVCKNDTFCRHCSWTFIQPGDPRLKTQDANTPA